VILQKLNPPSHTAFSQLDSSHPFHFKVSPIIFTPLYHLPYALPDILYNTSCGVFPLPRYLFLFPGTARKPNIAFLGLPAGRYEKLKLKALQTASGNLNLDLGNTVITQLEEKIANLKKRYRFEPTRMEQFDYHNSLVEFVSSTSASSHRPFLLYFALLGRSQS
jgi:hypothetical protein